MANERVVKVFHAARQDLEIIWNQARLIPHPIFDTQVAAMVCGFGEAVSYVNLVKQITRLDLDKTSRFTDWARRPLSAKQLDLRTGRRPALAGHLPLSEGGARGRDGPAGSTRRCRPDRSPAPTRPIRRRVAAPQAAREEPQRTGGANRAGRVARARGAGARRAAQPHSARRYALRHRQPAPTETAQLSELRSLSDGFAKSSRAKEIVEAVKRGLARDPKTVPPLRTGLPMPEKSSRWSICCACC